jgi:hypothetical protein
MNKIYFEKFKFNKYYKNIDLIDVAKLFINAAPKYYSFFYKNNILKNIVYDFKNNNSKNSKNIYFIRKDKKIIGVASLVTRQHVLFGFLVSYLFTYTSKHMLFSYLFNFLNPKP